MTKNVATVEGLTLTALIERLCQVGYQLSCPDTGRVHGFTSAGQPSYLTSQEVADFLVEGNGVLLWGKPNESLYVSQIATKPRISCDGLTVQQEQVLQKLLTSQGIIYSLAHEDAAYEA